MKKYLLILATLGLAQALPQNYPILHEPHELCPGDRHFLLPHEYDCTKFYYCEYGLKFIEPTDCAPGTEFSFEEQVCLHPWLANCTLPGYPPSSEKPSPGDGTTPGGSIIVTTAQPEEVATTAAVTLQPEEVATTISVTLQPEEVATTAETTLQPEAVPTPDTDESDPEDDPEDEPQFLENGCPANFREHALLPHETYCHKFYYCVRGELVLRRCALGTYFNPDIGVCDHPWKVTRDCQSPDYDEESDCNGDDCPPEDPEDNEDETTLPTTTKPSEESEDPESPQYLENGCPADIHVHKLLPHEKYCHKFYYCVRGELVLRQCASGSYFNSDIGNCDHIWNVNRDCVAPGDDDDNDENNCDGEDCYPEEGEDTEEDNENEADKPIELLPNGCPADFDIHKLLSHETECNKFYYCVFGEKVERTCANGTYFNFEIQTCDHPSNVNCVTGTTQEPDVTDAPVVTEGVTNGPVVTDGVTEAPVVTEGVTDGPVVTEGVTEAPVVTEGVTDVPIVTEGVTDGPVVTEGTTEGPGLTETPGIGNKCKEGCNILPWAHDTDCDKYWICNGDQPLMVVCQEGLHFNPATYTCDFMCNANCVREDVQATAEADGVKVFLPWDKVDNKLMELLKIQK